METLVNPASVINPELHQRPCNYFSINDAAKGGLAQYWDLLTVIPCAPRHLERSQHYFETFGFKLKPRALNNYTNLSYNFGLKT